jgi:predicted ester cyclase
MTPHQAKIAALLVAGTFQACSPLPSTPVIAPTWEQNKAVVRGYLEEISNQGRWAAIERYFSAEVVFNGARDVRPLLARQRAVRAAFPDHRVVIEEQIAEGDKVVTHVSFSGTHLGQFNGIAATGRQVVYSGIAIDRIVDGKVVEMWHIANTLALLQQIGATLGTAAK